MIALDPLMMKPSAGIGRVRNLRQKDGDIEFELVGHHAVSALRLILDRRAASSSSSSSTLTACCPNRA